MKSILWILAVAGLAGPCILAVLCLLANANASRATAETQRHSEKIVQIATESLPKGGTIKVLPTEVTAVGIGGPGFFLQLAARRWPAVMVLIGAAAFFVGLLFLMPKQSEVPPIVPHASARTADYPEH